MLRRFVTLCGVLAVLAIGGESALAATTYYVSPAPAGSDANAGTQGSPFATIQKAADVALAGDTVVVNPGTYVGAKLSKSGTAGSPIVFNGLAGAVVASPGAQNTSGDILFVSNASYVTVSGFEVKNGLRAGVAVVGTAGEGQVHGVVVRNVASHANAEYGIYTSFAEGVRIEGCETYDTANQHGIFVANSSDNPAIVGNSSHDNFLSGIEIDAVPSTDGDDDAIVNALVDSNVISDNGTGGGAGIRFVSVLQSLVINNLVVDNLALGIDLVNADDDLMLGSRENRIFNNTVRQAVGAGPAVTLDNAAIDNSVNNNILLHAGSGGSIDIDLTSESGLVSDFNVLDPPITVAGTPLTLADWQARGHDAHSFTALTTDLFVSVATGNYDLKPTSPAVDTGRPVTGVPDDIRGVLRPQGSSYDIGAYEFTTDTGTPNQNPVANAGTDQTVDPGDTVTLSGAGSTDPDGDTLTFAWTQTAGPAVTLVGASSASPNFVAPDVTTDTVLSFQLTVMDGNGGSATDSVSVSVTAPPPAKKIFVTKPAAGARWKIGTKKKVRFVAESGVTGDVRVELSRDGGQTFVTVVPTVAVDRRKTKVTVTGPATTQAVIRVISNADARVFGLSAVFTIAN